MSYNRRNLGVLSCTEWNEVRGMVGSTRACVVFGFSFSLGSDAKSRNMTRCSGVQKVPSRLQAASDSRLGNENTATD